MKLPQVSGPRLIRELQARGFYVKRQTGGHAIPFHPPPVCLRYPSTLLP